jgi:hypothetical protein
MNKINREIRVKKKKSFMIEYVHFNRSINGIAI